MSKKDKILSSALSLFAMNGYDGTSTNKVAQKAGVSQGLIFKHFENKEGLLKAILFMAQSRVLAFNDILSNITDPKEKLKLCINMPLHLTKEQRYFWRLLYSINWQAKQEQINFMDYIFDDVSLAFKKLKYKNYKRETELFLMIMNGITVKSLRNNTSELKAYVKFIEKKYDLS